MIQKNDSFGVINAEGKRLLDLLYEEPESLFRYFRARRKSNHNFEYFMITLHPIEAGDITEIQPLFTSVYGVYYKIKEAKLSYALISSEGKRLTEYAYEEIDFSTDFHVFIVTKNKNKGLYDPVKGWLLPCEYQTIDKVSTIVELFQGDSQAIAYIVGQTNPYGLFVTGSRHTWAVPLAYKNLQSLVIGKPGRLLLAYLQNGLGASSLHKMRS